MAVTAAQLVDLYMEAIRQRLAGENVRGYGINGRNIDRDSLEELRAGLEQAQQMAAAEAAASSGNKNPFKMFGIRYGRPR